MASFASLFRWKNPTLRKLIGWRQNDEEEKWATKAVETLLKKLRNKKSSIVDLQFALANPELQSNCVTIPRSIDGRLQVSHKKSFPHVIYCKVWRWPDIQSHHEIKAIDTCQYAFSKKADEVCINPYHYIRVEKPALPPILVPKYSEQQLASIPITSLFMQHSQTPQNFAMNFGENFCNGPMETAYSAYPHAQNSGSSHQCSPSDSPNYGITPPHTPPPAYSPFQNTSSENLTSVQYQETPTWASISYYELNQRVGEIFQVKNSSIQVDGFTNPSSHERFSLGVLSNIHRNSSIENTRRHIGKGINVWYIGGEVFVECISECSVFVQSGSFNCMNNFALTTVVKLIPGSSIKIFNEQAFANLLANSVHRGFEGVYDLTKLCVFRLSFVKGWGRDYHRHDITSTPCWIEVQIHGALQWLDKVLTQMGSPTSAISSVS